MPGFSRARAGVAEADDELLASWLMASGGPANPEGRSGSRGFGGIVATADRQDGGHDRVFTVGQGLHAFRQRQTGHVDGGAAFRSFRSTSMNSGRAPGRHSTVS